MKKIYLSFMCVASTIAATAQISSISQQMVRKNNFSTEGAKVVANPTTEKATPFWTNDFTTPGDWSFGNLEATGTPGANDNWTIGTAGGAGPFSLDALVSVSGGNFGLFDSDFLCASNGSQSGWMKNVTAIDCSGKSSVLLKFQNYFRKLNANACFVGVSTDGIVWTDIQVNGLLAGNVATANGELCQVNISSVAANQATVYIRFLYKSQGTANFYGCDYNWMVDDVKLSIVDDYDLSLDKVIWGSEGNWGGLLSYRQVPVDQVQPIQFCGVVTNLGLLSQSDILVTASSTGYAGTTTAATLASNELDTFCVTPAFTPSSTPGSSVVAFATTSGATDANTASNSQPSETIVVTEFIYARDNGIVDGSQWNDGAKYEVGNVYDIHADATLQTIDVVLHPSTVVGSVIYGIVYDPTQATFTEMARTDDYVLTAADISVSGAPVVLSLSLQSPLDVTASSTILAVVGTEGATSPDILVYTGGTSEEQTSYFMDETGEWFYTTRTPMVRLNFDPSASVKSLSNTVGFSVYPNPASTQATISCKVANSSAVVVSVLDLAGKVVYSNDLGTVNSGAHTVTINTDAIANGVYMVNVSVNGSVSTEKLVIRK